MFDLVRDHRRLFQIFLLLLILPSFVALGIKNYNEINDSDKLVSLGNLSIGQAELDNAVRNQLEEIKRSLGDKYDSKLYDTPQERQKILDSLVNQKILQTEVIDTHLSATDNKLLEIVKTIPGVYSNNALNESAYKQFIATRVPNGNVTQFEQGVKLDMGMQSLLNTVQSAAFISQNTVKKILTAQNRAITVQSVLFKPDAYSASLKIDQSMLSKYYTDHFKQFEQPESAQVEYFVLNSLTDQHNNAIELSEAELKAYYDSENKKNRFINPEQRKVSHILFKLDSKSSKEQINISKLKADKVWAELKKDPKQFPLFAKQQSEDAGSSDQGGDLGIFTKESMAVMGQSFVDSAFSLQMMDISQPIKTDYGWHIIQVNHIQLSQTKPLEVVKSELETELKSSRIASMMVEKKKNIASALALLDPSSSLKPLADEFKLELKTVTDFNRNFASQSPQSIAHKDLTSKVVQILFNKDSIDNKTNTGLIEISKGVWIVARLTVYTPAKTAALELIKDKVETQLRHTLALKAAKLAADARLTALQKNPNQVVDAISQPQTVSRHRRNELTMDSFAAVMRASVGALPAWVGVTLSTGEYALCKIIAIDDSSIKNDVNVYTTRQALQRIYAEQEAQTVLAVLKDRHHVKYNKSMQKY